MISFLEAEQSAQHRARNRLHTAVLVGALGALMLTAAGLLWGGTGVLWTALIAGGLLAFSPRLPPEAVMRIYRAQAVDIRHAPQLLQIVEALANRAELPAVPKLYVVPSKTLNAFATGRAERSAIAVTEGLLRTLDTRELTGVLAHEMSHIRNHDVTVMGLADVMSRMMQFMSLLAVVLVILFLPAIFSGTARVPWLAIGLLYFGPSIASLLQLALSRTREFDADLEGAMLTGDPEGLALALRKLDRYAGHFWEDLLPSGRRVPHPSLLRTHPTTKERVARLRALVEDGIIKAGDRLPHIVVSRGPMVTSIGVGPIEMRPRYRLPGLWF